MCDKKEINIPQLFSEFRHNIDGMGYDDLINNFGKKTGVELWKLKVHIKDMSAYFGLILKELSQIFPEIDPEDPNLKETPDRLANSYIEMFSGCGIEPMSLLEKSFPVKNYDSIIILKNIEFTSICSHHFRDITGIAHIGYLPDTKNKGGVLGISKLARLLDAHAKRPQTQEILTTDILMDLVEAVKPKGAGVVIEATHNCISCRGVKKKGAIMKTSAMDGLFRHDLRVKEEFFTLIKD